MKSLSSKSNRTVKFQLPGEQTTSSLMSLLRRGQSSALIWVCRMKQFFIACTQYPSSLTFFGWLCKQSSSQGGMMSFIQFSQASEGGLVPEMRSPWGCSISAPLASCFCCAPRSLSSWSLYCGSSFSQYLRMTEVLIRSGVGSALIFNRSFCLSRWGSSMINLGRFLKLAVNQPLQGCDLLLLTRPFPEDCRLPKHCLALCLEECGELQLGCSKVVLQEKVICKVRDRVRVVRLGQQLHFLTVKSERIVLRLDGRGIPSLTLRGESGSTPLSLDQDLSSYFEPLQDRTLLLLVLRSQPFFWDLSKESKRVDLWEAMELTEYSEGQSVLVKGTRAERLCLLLRGGVREGGREVREGDWFGRGAREGGVWAEQARCTRAGVVAWVKVWDLRFIVGRSRESQQILDMMLDR